MGKGTVVLAYSGGLDTSICIPLLRERYGYDRVVTVVVNVGSGTKRSPRRPRRVRNSPMHITR